MSAVAWARALVAETAAGALDADCTLAIAGADPVLATRFRVSEGDAAEWRAHPQGRALAAAPLVERTRARAGIER